MNRNKVDEHLPHYLRNDLGHLINYTKYSSKLGLKNTDVQLSTKPKQRPSSAKISVSTKPASSSKRRVKSATNRRVLDYVTQCRELTAADTRKPPIQEHKHHDKAWENTGTAYSDYHSYFNGANQLAKPTIEHTRPNQLQLALIRESTNNPALPRSQDPDRLPWRYSDLAKLGSTAVPNCLSGLGLEGSLFLIPSLNEYSRNLPIVADDDARDLEHLPYTHKIPEKKPVPYRNQVKENITSLLYPNKPKKYSHPFFERVKSIQGWKCRHTQDKISIESTQGDTTLYSRVLSAQRDGSEIRQEILELERLMKGLSSEFGTSTVVLYQNEINSIQRQIENMNLPEKPGTPSTPTTPDPTGLRAFIKNYESALHALTDRHQQCLDELSKLTELEDLFSRAKLLDSNS